MAKKLGVDPKTLRKWARDKQIPSYRNPVNEWYYYNENEVRKALQLYGLDFKL